MTQTKKDPRKVRWTLVHPSFHFDEALAVYILTLFGKVLFPGIEEARIVFKLRDIEGITPEQMRWSADRLLNELGVLCVGCLGERGALFDEHGEKRADGKAACMLVAEYLGVAKQHEIRDLLCFVDQFDRQGHARERAVLRKVDRYSVGLTEYDIRALLRNQHRNGRDDVYLMQWMQSVIDAFVERTRRLIKLHGLVKGCNKKRSVTGDGTEIQVWLIETDEHDAPTVAQQHGAGVVIVRRPTGHAVVVNKSKRADMCAVARELRQREADAQGWSVVEGDTLDGEHSASVPNWDFNPTMGHIFNTDEQKVYDVVPTALSDEELLDMVAGHLRILEKTSL
ncbi:MAG: hypothetical protein RL150_619 [Candidatus Parcubacteria bacterium]